MTYECKIKSTRDEREKFVDYVLNGGYREATIGGEISDLVSSGNDEAKNHRYEEAIAFYNKAICLLNKTNAPMDLCRVYINMGFALAQTGIHDEAFDYHRRAEDIFVTGLRREAAA